MFYPLFSFVKRLQRYNNVFELTNFWDENFCFSFYLLRRFRQDYYLCGYAPPPAGRTKKNVQSTEEKNKREKRKKARDIKISGFTINIMIN